MDLLSKEETKRKESADSVSVTRETHRKHQSNRHHDDRDHLKKKEKR